MKYALIAVEVEKSDRQAAATFLAQVPDSELLAKSVLVLGRGSWLIPLQSDSDLLGHLLYLAGSTRLPHKVLYFQDGPTVFEKK